MSMGSYIAIAFATYVIGTASPGPANMTIMMTSMQSGRRAGLALACGVIGGSLTWGLVAGLGFGALMLTYAHALIWLKIAGGLYMFWLAWRALRACRRNDASFAPMPSGEKPRAQSVRSHFLRGLGLHLTNPKAILVWMSVITLGLPPDADQRFGLWIIAACSCLGMVIFTAYAIAFSTSAAVTFYARQRRKISGAMAFFYAAIGARLVAS
ncbi:LysE family translocator [Methylovirgula sp. 4M-Z18]|uniref:LysE family translocator n=1 Tax=Methylovirgula sp. 4M-Z18 TaxID=2293567 RepID=UPI001314C076|nr:LysE family translocator [Methylovirgula sp. 4M-Z18]